MIVKNLKKDMQVKTQCSKTKCRWSKDKWMRHVYGRVDIFSGYYKISKTEMSYFMEDTEKAFQTVNEKANVLLWEQ